MEPTGVPSSLKPVVSSTGVVVLSLLMSTEYLAIVRWRMVAVVSGRRSMMLSPEHDVKIRVFCGLTMHPRLTPSRSISVQKNSMSSWATVEDISSMYAKRCAMLPNPSSPRSPDNTRACALSFSALSSGCSIRWSTSVAKIGDRGHP